MIIFIWELHFNCNGTFKKAVKRLCDKASSSMFKILKRSVHIQLQRQTVLKTIIYCFYSATKTTVLRNIIQCVYSATKTIVLKTIIYCFYSATKTTVLRRIIYYVYSATKTTVLRRIISVYIQLQRLQSSRE